jgi:hypothetical protein
MPNIALQRLAHATSNKARSWRIRSKRLLASADTYQLTGPNFFNSFVNLGHQRQQRPQAVGSRNHQDNSDIESLQVLLNPDPP